MNVEDGELKLERPTRSKLGLILMVVTGMFSLYGLYRARVETIELLHVTQAKENAIQGLLDDENYGWAFMNDEGQVIEWNRALVRLTGRTYHEIHKYGLGLIMPDELYAKHQKAFFNRMQSLSDAQELVKKSTVVFCDINTSTGEKVPIRITLRFIKGPDSKIYTSAHIDRVDDIRLIDPINVSKNH